MQMLQRLQLLDRGMLQMCERWRGGLSSRSRGCTSEVRLGRVCGLGERLGCGVGAETGDLRVETLNKTSPR